MKCLLLGIAVFPEGAVTFVLRVLARGGCGATSEAAGVGEGEAKSPFRKKANCSSLKSGSSETALTEGVQTIPCSSVHCEVDGVCEDLDDDDHEELHGAEEGYDQYSAEVYPL